MGLGLDAASWHLSDLLGYLSRVLVVERYQLVKTNLMNSTDSITTCYKVLRKPNPKLYTSEPQTLSPQSLNP